MNIGVKWEGSIPEDRARLINERPDLEVTFDEEWRAFRCSPNFVSPGAALKYANRVREELPKPIPSGEHALLVWPDGAKNPISFELFLVFALEKKERSVEPDDLYAGRDDQYPMAGQHA